MRHDENFVVAVDFDGTVTQGFVGTATGPLNQKAREVLLQLKALGCVLVLWTTREGDELEEAVGLLDEWGIPMDWFNEYPLRNGFPKVNADFHIDDKAWTGPIDWDAVLRHVKELKECRTSKTHRA